MQKEFSWKENRSQVLHDFFNVSFYFCHSCRNLHLSCVLSPFLFLLVIDWIMKMTTDGAKKKQKTSNQVDPKDTIKRLGFCRWPSPVLPHSSTDSKPDIKTGIHILASGRPRHPPTEDSSTESQHIQCRYYQSPHMSNRPVAHSEICRETKTTTGKIQTFITSVYVKPSEFTG